MAATATSRWVYALGAIVLVGVVARVVYTLVHGDSLSVLGIDARYYHNGANLLADGYGFVAPVQLINTGIATPGADHPPAYQVFLAATSVVGLKSVLTHQLWSCVLGAASVAFVGLAGREVIGPRVGLIAAGIAAAYPSLWFNDGLLMSESLIVGVTAAAMFLAYRFWHRPTFLVAGLLGADCGVAILTRAEAVLFVPLLVVPVMLIARELPLARRVELLGVALGVVLVVVGPWVVYNLTRFEKPVTVSTGLGQTLFAGNCHDTYYGSRIGYWSLHCLFTSPPIPNRDESVQEVTYRHLASTYVSDHRRRLPFVVFARLGRTWGFYAPFGQLHFDESDNNREFPMSMVALFMFYALVAASIVGGVTLRRRGIPLLPLLAPILVVTLAAAFTYGQTRLRAPAEVSLALLAAVAADDRLARRRSRRSDGGSLIGQTVTVSG